MSFDKINKNTGIWSNAQILFNWNHIEPKQKQTELVITMKFPMNMLSRHSTDLSENVLFILWKLVLMPLLRNYHISIEFYGKTLDKIIEAFDANFNTIDMIIRVQGVICFTAFFTWSLWHPAATLNRSRWVFQSLKHCIAVWVTKSLSYKYS